MSTEGNPQHCALHCAQHTVPLTAQHTVLQAARHRVLVVEDQAFQRRALVRVLKSLGFAQVIEAGDGRQALELLAGAGASVDLVITDLDMPTMDGIALMRHIGQHAPQAGIVLLSAVDHRLLDAVEWLARELHIPLLAILAKPVTAQALRAIQATLCDRDRGRAHAAASVVAPPEFTVSDIAQGLAAGQFEAFLQPKISFAEGQIVGAEALARWRHPRFGWVAPLTFIDTIEASPLIEPFSLAMLESAAWGVRWLQACDLPGQIALNASPAWLDQPGMADRLSQAVARLGLPVERLTIEVTESTANSNLGAALENLARLRLRGFTLSVDDFGTGFSSLTRLLHSPFSELKLDRSFVSGVERNTPRWHVIESTLTLARKLGLKTVAEGVETQAEWQLLKEAGCDCLQGYLVAKPMGRDDFLRWATGYRRASEPAQREPSLAALAAGA